MFRTRTIWLSAFAALVLALAVAPAAGAKPVPGPGGPATRPLEIPYLSHGQGVDKSLFRGEVQRHEGVLAGYGEQPAAQDPIEIPYLSQGIGVDKSLFKDRATARKAGETSGGYYDPPARAGRPPSLRSRRPRSPVTTTRPARAGRPPSLRRRRRPWS